MEVELIIAQKLMNLQRPSRFALMCYNEMITATECIHVRVHLRMLYCCFESRLTDDIIEQYRTLIA